MNRIAVLAVLAANAGSAIAAPAPPRAGYIVEIEGILVEKEGTRSLAPRNMPGLPLDESGELHSVWRLGPAPADVLVWSVGYEREDDEVVLKVTRTLRRDTKATDLDPVTHRMPLLGAWTTTLWDGPEGRLDVRVVILVRPAFEDEPLQEGSIGMWTRGGALILLARRGDPEGRDEVIFTGVNGGGQGGLSFGVPGAGAFRLAPRPFPGATKCGWVRGHRLSASIDGHEIALWSEVPILPDDPSRPGFGWTLFGTLSPLEVEGAEGAFYGGFDPATVTK